MKCVLFVCLLSLMVLLINCYTDNEKNIGGTNSAMMWLLAQQISSLDKRLQQLAKNMEKHSLGLAVSKLEQAVESIKRDVKTLYESNAAAVTKIESKIKILKGGVEYTHWGRTNCTSPNAKTIYTGFMGGSYYGGGTGGAANKLCLPHQPQWGVYDNKINDSPYIGATLMDNWDINIKDTLFDKKYSYYRIECASCLTKSTTSTTMMIPGRRTCYDGWRKEYSGYLMSGYPSHTTASEYLCLDGKPDFLHEIPSWSYKSLIFSVYSKCNGATSCPPYVEGREMVCVVCSK